MATRASGGELGASGLRPAYRHVRSASFRRKNASLQSHLFFRPFGALGSFHPRPTVETVGYFRSSLTGLSVRCSSAVQPGSTACTLNCATQAKQVRRWKPPELAGRRPALVWGNRISFTVAASYFSRRRGANDEHIRQRSVRSEQRSLREKELPPFGLR